MAKINWRQFNIEIDRPLRRACRQIATKTAEDKFNSDKEEFLSKFENHEVSVAIRERAGGIEQNGTLFGFIGFRGGSDPVGDLYEYLNENIEINLKGKYISSARRYDFQVSIPSKDDIKSVTPMPWGAGKSWAFSIESGISGLNRYLSLNKGRSGQGLQAKSPRKDRAGVSYKPRKYMSNLLNSLIRSISKK